MLSHPQPTLGTNAQEMNCFDVLQDWKGSHCGADITNKGETDQK